MIGDVQAALEAGLAAYPRPVFWLGDEESSFPPKTAEPDPPAGFLELDLEAAGVRGTFSGGRLEGLTLVADVFFQSGTPRATLGSGVDDLLRLLAAFPKEGRLRVIHQLADEGELLARGETEEWTGRRLRVPLFWSGSAAVAEGDEP